MKSSPPLPNPSLVQPPQTLSNSLAVPPTPLIRREAEFALMFAQLRGQLSETEFLRELKRGAEMVTKRVIEEALHHLSRIPHMVNNG